MPRLIVWDGGNNDFPFVRPQLHIVRSTRCAPATRPRIHPGEAVLRMADIALIAKSDTATPAQHRAAHRQRAHVNPRRRSCAVPRR